MAMLYHIADGRYDLITDTIQVHYRLRGRPLAERVQRAHNGLQVNMANSMDSLMPERDGYLRAETRKRNTEMIGTEYVYAAAGVAYGRYQYGGKVMVGETTGSPFAKKGEKKVITDRMLRYSRPEAVAEWYEAAKDRDAQKWVDQAQRDLEGP